MEMPPPKTPNQMLAETLNVLASAHRPYNFGVELFPKYNAARLFLQILRVIGIIWIVLSVFGFIIVLGTALSGCARVSYACNEIFATSLFGFGIALVNVIAGLMFLVFAQFSVAILDMAEYLRQILVLLKLVSAHGKDE